MRHREIVKMAAAEERQAIVDYLRDERWGVCEEHMQECCWYCTRLQAATAIAGGFHHKYKEEHNAEG